MKFIYYFFYAPFIPIIIALVLWTMIESYLISKKIHVETIIEKTVKRLSKLNNYDDYICLAIWCIIGGVFGSYLKGYYL